MKVGDKVQLKSGGIYMTINMFSKTLAGSSFSKEKDEFALCVWIDDNHQPQKAIYSTEALIVKDKNGDYTIS